MPLSCISCAALSRIAERVRRPRAVVGGGFIVDSSSWEWAAPDGRRLVSVGLGNEGQ